MTPREQIQQEYETLKGVPALLQECISKICTPDACMQALLIRLRDVKTDVVAIVDQGQEELHRRFLRGSGE